MRKLALYAFLIFSALAVVALFFSLFSRAATDESGEMSATVTRGSIEEVVLALGTLEPSSIVRVGAQVTGQVKVLYVGIGQSVRPGQLIAEIDSIPQQNALKIARAKVDDVKAQRRVKEIQIVQAGSVFQRKSGLIERNAISQTDVEEAEARYQTLRAELASLEAQIIQSEVDLQTAEANLAYTRITAPIGGKVVALPVERGQTLNSAQTTPTVAVIADLDEMVVKIKISEADVWRTQPGQNAWFTILGDPQTRYDARLETIEFAPPSIGADPAQEVLKESAKDNAVYYHGVLRVKNPEEKLRTKMTAQVRISVGKSNDALLVPWAALSSRQANGSYLVKIKNGTSQPLLRSVRMGYTDKINAQIIEGLRLGDTVLLNVSAPGAP